MRKFSEKSFGARLENARRLSAQLELLADYNPTDTAQTKGGYMALINDVADKNNEAAGALHLYSTAVEARQQLFQKDNDSVEKLMTPVLAAFRSGFGKSSKEVAVIKNLTDKITGASSKKKTPKSKVKTVSQSARSFGNILQTYSDLVTTLERYGDAYNPADDAIKTAALKLKIPKLIEAGKNVANSRMSLTKARDERSKLYETLSETTDRIKEGLKSQYRSNSVVYKAAKGLLV